MNRMTLENHKAAYEQMWNKTYKTLEAYLATLLPEEISDAAK